MVAIWSERGASRSTSGGTVVTAAAVASCCVVGAACKPNLDQTVSIVSQPQVLAVRADPAETPPRGTTTYSALVASSSATLSVPIEWAFCNARKPLAQLGPVSPQCLQASGAWFAPFGTGLQAQGTIPAVACKQFGPDVPLPEPHQPPGRPVDPDSTGGYYQPVRVLVPNGAADVIAIAESRLSCGVAGTPEQVVLFSQHYILNANPAIDSVTAGHGTPWSADETGATNRVHPSEDVPLEVTWASCPRPTGVCGDGYCDLTEGKETCPADCVALSGCSGAETYVNLDLVSHELATEREGMAVAWFATAGAFDDDRTGRAPDDATNSTTNHWHAPALPMLVRMWIVLRDDRGGAGWREYRLDVR